MSDDPGRAARHPGGRLLVVGPGRVGGSLALDLARSPDLRVALAGRGPEPPRLSAEGSEAAYLPAGHPPELPPAPPFPEAADPAPLGLVFCVPDDALADAARAWADALARAGARPGDPWSPATALHTSGVHPGEALAPLRRLGAAVGSWHPAVAISTAAEGRFRGVTVGVEGDPGALEAGRRLAEALGARPVRVRPGEKARWHAAAVFASNHLLACLAVALREMKRAAEDPVDLEDLLPLARSALEGVARGGLAAGATGPVARGDAGTVDRHLASLDPETGSLYRGLARELLRLVGDRLPAARRETLEARLRTGAGVLAGRAGDRETGERGRGEGGGRCGST